MLDGRVIAAYQKQPVVHDGLPMFNLGLGAIGVEVVPLDEVKSLAVNAMNALGLRLAAVDIVVLADGTYKVLEVNDGIMMENYMRQSQTNKKHAETIYGMIIDAMMT